MPDVHHPGAHEHVHAHAPHRHDQSPGRSILRVSAWERLGVTGGALALLWLAVALALDWF